MSNTRNDEELLQIVKKHANLKRTPRNLNVFYAFLNTWRIHNPDNNSNLVKERESSDMFISTKMLQNVLGINSKQYAKYFDAWVAEWKSTEHSYVHRKCKLIKSFTEDFLDMMANPVVKNCIIPDEIKKQVSSSTTEFGKDNLEIIKSRIESLNLSDTEISQLLMDYYTSTYSSPFRSYHWIQNTLKEIRRQIFKGYWDVDLEQAFASIAWNELDFKNSNIAFGFFLNPEMKSDFRKKVMEDFGFDSESKAKQLINCLFSQPYEHSWGGPQWFDNLHKEITNRFISKCETVVGWKGKRIKLDTMHKFFTYHEQMIIDTLAQTNSMIANFHDGIVTISKPKSNYVSYNGNQYKLSVNQF